MRPELIAAFSESIWAKVRVAREVELELRERRRLLEAISEDIKKFTDLLPPLVSEAAHLEAQRRGVDLRQKGWHDQSRFDPGRRVFQWEHVLPVGSMREQCLRATSPTAVAQILEAGRVAWILKEEDRRLTGLGYRATRPDPDAAYRQAGITLVEPTDMADLPADQPYRPGSRGEAGMSGSNPYCNALGCRNVRIRPNSTHCPTHEAEWHAIQRDQKYGVTSEIRQRRKAMGMSEFPRTSGSTGGS